MLKLDTPIMPQLQQFLRWWKQELGAMLPAGLNALLGNSGEHLLLYPEAEGLRVSHLTAAGEQLIGQYRLDDSGREQRERLFAEQPALAEIPLALQLPPQQALRKRIKLPMAAEENLTQVLRFEMDRLTPFKQDQIYFDFHIAERLSDSRQMVVELILTPRRKLDTLLDALTRTGWQPQTVYLADEARPGDYNLLPGHYSPNRARWPRIANIAAASLIALLLIAIGLLPLLSARSEASRLEEQVAKLGKTAREVESLKQESDSLLHQARFLEERKRSEPVIIDMLEELSRIIPDTTWLNGLQYKDKRIIIQGQSPSASSLIEQIETSNFFTDTSFVSPVTKDTSNGLERFQIASGVVNGRSSETPH